MIISLIRKSKQKYYSDFFTEHNNNIKKTWKGIRQLVNVNKKKSISIKLINENNKPITDNKEMANAFNNFYANLGNSIEQKIPKTQKHFTSYLNTQTNSIFQAIPCDECEISSYLILEQKKHLVLIVSKNLLKEHSSLLTHLIKILVNKSLEEGAFPTLLKTAAVCPIYKKSDKTKCVNS